MPSWFLRISRIPIWSPPDKQDTQETNPKTTTTPVWSKWFHSWWESWWDFQVNKVGFLSPLTTIQVNRICGIWIAIYSDWRKGHSKCISCSRVWDEGVREESFFQPRKELRKLDWHSPVKGWLRVEKGFSNKLSLMSVGLAAVLLV